MMGNRKYTVCILGASLDTNNRGVSALSHSLIKIILEREKNARITLIVSHRNPGMKEVFISGRLVKIQSLNYRLSPRSKLQEHLLWIFFLSFIYKLFPIQALRNGILNANTMLHTIYKADFIGDIQGGDSFSDIYGLPRLLVQILVDIAILNLGKKLVLLPQTYGPYKSHTSRIMASHIVNKAHKIISRDYASIELVNGLLKSRAKTKRVLYSPDVAFILDPARPESHEFNPPLTLEKKAPFLGFNISGLLFKGGYTRDDTFGFRFNYSEFVIELINVLLHRTDETILLIPHTYSNVFNPDSIQDDRNACLNVINSLGREEKNRVSMLYSCHSPGEIKWIISHCNFFIGSRMHSCIAALSQGIPTIGIAYSKKFKGVFKSVKMENFVIDPREDNKEVVMNKIYECYDKKEVDKDYIMNNIIQAKKILNEIFNRLIIRTSIDK